VWVSRGILTSKNFLAFSPNQKQQKGEIGMEKGDDNQLTSSYSLTYL